MVDFHIRGTKENASVLDPMFHVLEEEERLRETSPPPGDLVVHPGVMKLVLDEVSGRVGSAERIRLKSMTRIRMNQ